MNFFDHKDLGNHLLQLCPKVVKHPVYETLPVKFCALPTGQQTLLRTIQCILSYCIIKLAYLEELQNHLQSAPVFESFYEP